MIKPIIAKNILKHNKYNLIDRLDYGFLVYEDPETKTLFLNNERDNSGFTTVYAIHEDGAKQIEYDLRNINKYCHNEVKCHIVLNQFVDAVLLYINGKEKVYRDLMSDIKPSDMDNILLAAKKYPQELNNNFWRWFGNSETIDKNGNPLIFYHGTKQRFNKFKSAYDDHLVFFAYDKSFSDDWSRNSHMTKEQKALQDLYYDDISKYNNKLWSEYSEKYNDNSWVDFSDKERKRDWDEYINRKNRYIHKIERRIDTAPRTMSVYIKAENIFRPERDYELVLDDILENFKDENEDDVIKYTKEGHWSYYEMSTEGSIIRKIFDELGFDAIELEEVRGQGITTLAVRDNTFQIKSVYNNGDFDPYSNNIYR